MSEDLFDQTFADLDEYYPGSKRKRREPAKQVQSAPVADWDSRSYKKTLPNGKEVEMFTLGSLADALNRPLPTVRLWMKEGNLPESSYRLPSATTKAGKEIAGRRLYTREMIEVVVELFARAGLLETNRVDWRANRHLTNEIAEAWDKIRVKNATAN